MATSGIQRIKDIAVTSIECGNRLIIDREANVNVPTLFADNILTVDIGGAVNLEATTINLRNTHIDFTGAVIKGFCGNVCGQSDISNHTVFAAKQSAIITAEIFSGSLVGDVVSAKTIEENIIGQGIELLGTLTGDIAGTFTGKHTGDVATTYITHLGHSPIIQVNGTMNGNFSGIFRGDAALGYVVPLNDNEPVSVIGDLSINGYINASDYWVDGKQVIGKRLPPISSLPITSNISDIINQQEQILRVLRLHGLIEK